MRKKEQNRKKKVQNIQNRGITLIALVITIIVLLILAGVTIATLTGNNGILTRATEASKQTENKGLKEEIELAVGSKNMGDQIDESGNLEEELNKINGVTVSKVTEDAYYVERDGIGYTVYKDGTIEEGKVVIWDGETVEKPEVDEQGNWHIYTAAQMKFFADYCNNELTEANMPEITETTTVYLENNIDMGARQKDGELISGTQWTPIDSFEGIFDGKEYFMTGIYIKSESSLVGGIFNFANVVKNTIIKNSYVEINHSFMQVVGGIVGCGDNITNCHNINTTVKCAENENISRVGGIVAMANSKDLKIEDCTNSGTIIGNTDVGGIAAGSSPTGRNKKNNIHKLCKYRKDKW